MRTVNVTWDIPVTREDGKPLPPDEIDYTEVFLSTDGVNFESLSKVEPDATQTVTRFMPDGTYKFRFVVVDTLGKKSKPVDATAEVISAPPGIVTNIKVTVE